MCVSLSAGWWLASDVAPAVLCSAVAWLWLAAKPLELVVERDLRAGEDATLGKDSDAELAENVPFAGLGVWVAAVVNKPSKVPTARRVDGLVVGEHQKVDVLRGAPCGVVLEAPFKLFALDHLAHILDHELALLDCLECHQAPALVSGPERRDGSVLATLEALVGAGHAARAEMRNALCVCDAVEALERHASGLAVNEHARTDGRVLVPDPPSLAREERVRVDVDKAPAVRVSEFAHLCRNGVEERFWPLHLHSSCFRSSCILLFLFFSLAVISCFCRRRCLLEIVVRVAVTSVMVPVLVVVMMTMLVLVSFPFGRRLFFQHFFFFFFFHFFFCEGAPPTFARFLLLNDLNPRAASHRQHRVERGCKSLRVARMSLPAGLFQVGQSRERARKQIHTS